MTKRNCIHGQIIDRKSVENIPRYHLHLSIDMSEKRENRSLTHEESRPRFTERGATEILEWHLHNRRRLQFIESRCLEL
ncbi:hypothetical protein V1478_010737 [Vespula squamosa]|uniref:Uncharacterized protein n=1 Tax=Vespula squamosa TaxID=30214 RepID=A0ABD2AHE6_VESSQ